MKAGIQDLWPWDYKRRGITRSIQVVQGMEAALLDAKVVIVIDTVIVLD